MKLFMKTIIFLIISLTVSNYVIMSLSYTSRIIVAIVEYEHDKTEENVQIYILPIDMIVCRFRISF